MLTDAEYLLEARIHRGISKAELARRAEISERTVRNIERGEYAPSLATAMKLARAMRMSFHDVWCRDYALAAPADVVVDAEAGVRICASPACDVRLSQYNPDPRCSSCAAA